MSIQGAINQMIGTAGVASALYQQSPAHKQALAKKEAKKIEEQYDKPIEQVASAIDELQSKKMPIPEQFHAELEGNIIAKQEALAQAYGSAGMYSKSTEALREVKLFRDISKQRTLERQQLEKENKLSVKKRKSYLESPTSLGGTLKDLNLDAQQKREIRAQLYPKKGASK